MNVSKKFYSIPSRVKLLWFSVQFDRNLSWVALIFSSVCSDSQFKLDVYKQETGNRQETDLVPEVAPPEVGHLKRGLPSGTEYLRHQISTVKWNDQTSKILISSGGSQSWWQMAGILGPKSPEFTYVIIIRAPLSQLIFYLLTFYLSHNPFQALKKDYRMTLVHPFDHLVLF